MLKVLFGESPDAIAAREAKKKKDLEFAYDDFEWKVAPLLTMGRLEQVKDLFVKSSVDSQMKNPGEEGKILLKFDGIVKKLMRKPGERIRRGAFDDI